MIPIIDWRITNQCDNHCLYCYGNKPIKRMNVEAEQQILNQIIASSCSIVNITGGEPLLDAERCFNMIRFLHKHAKSVYLSTNGVGLLGKMDFIAQHVALLGLPLDGYDSITNQINGRAPSSFQIIKEILEDSQKRSGQINIKVGTVITKKNCTREHLTRMCDFLKQYTIGAWRIYEMIPVNRGKKNRKALELNEEERDFLKETVEMLRKRVPHMNIELATRTMRNSAYFIIQPDGSVIIPTDSSTGADEIVIGNLLQDSLSIVYEKWKEMASRIACTDYLETRENDVVNPMTTN